VIAWIQRTLTSSTTGNPSTKRTVFLLASVALIVSLLGLTFACARWIIGAGDLGAGSVGALLGIAASVAALAGVGYRKNEVGAAAPSAPGGESADTSAGCANAADRGKDSAGLE
jgi:hypothetical protein